MTKILVTGAGGTGGIDFVRALRLAEKQQNQNLFIACIDHNPHYLNFAEADAKVVSPRHDDAGFIPLLLKLIEKHKIEFLHPHPSSEAQVSRRKFSAF